MSKPWYERKREVQEAENETVVRSLGGWMEAERLPPGRTTGPSCRVYHRGTGKMVAGWDKSSDGSVTYFVVDDTEEE